MSWGLKGKKKPCRLREIMHYKNKPMSYFAPRIQIRMYLNPNVSCQKAQSQCYIELLQALTTALHPSCYVHITQCRAFL